MVNHYHGLFFEVEVKPNGQGAALNKVCTMHNPITEFRGNVMHTNDRF